jgi:hypothetical protein
MAKLVSDDPGAAPDDLVLEVDRVEDARTVRQRLRIPAAEWRAFLRAQGARTAPRSVERAYAARREFWDWLAAEQADTPPAAPGPDAGQEPVAPSAAWLSARFAEWQERT